MIVKSRFLIPLLARVSIAFRAHLGGTAHGLIRLRAVGVIFLVRDQPAVWVQLQTRRAEVVAELVALNRRRYIDWIAAFGSLRFDQRDALLVVHYMQRLALQRHSRTVAVVFAIDLKAADVDAFVVSRAVRRLDHFAHALATGVVNIVSDSSASQVHFL